MYKRGQLISTADLMTSVFVFFILISFLFLTFTKYQEKIDTAVNNEDINLRAIQISEFLVKNSGEPINWEDDILKLNILGLVTSDRKLSDDKIKKFIDLDYETIRNKLNIMSFDFYFSIKNLNGQIMEISDGDNGNVKKVENGTKPSLNAKKVVTIKRFALYGNEEKIIEFTLWK